MKVHTVPVSESVGLHLSHDVTQVDVVNGFKGARFCRGHQIRKEDVPILRSMGREELAVLLLEEGEVHEDDASLRLARCLQGSGLTLEGPSEGKCSLFATHRGLLSFDEEVVHAINEDTDWVLATLPPNISVEKGERVASFRIAPLIVKEDQVARVEKLATPVSVLPFRPYSVALVTTGREIAEGLVQDAFEPQLRKKIQFYGASFAGHSVVGDSKDEITKAVRSFLAEETSIIICTGGMSIDVEDRTPEAIVNIADDVIFRGIPVLPGSNLMLARTNESYIIGAPACVVACHHTSLDLILDRLFAGVVPTQKEIRRWGVGGLCRSCTTCFYPVCSFASRMH